MITVELTAEEAVVLHHALDTLLSDVRMEMCDTDRADFRDTLRTEKAALEHLLAQLPETVGQ